MYQVGFGDCFLLTFLYEKPLDDGRRERHLLIDFGSTRWSKGHPGKYRGIAQDVAERTSGRLDVIVVTHRHKDHLSGFGDDQASAILAGLSPALVLRPWTENPDIARDATGPRLSDRSVGFVRSLAAGQAFARETSEVLTGERGLRGDLAHMAAEQIANAAAIDWLDEASANAPHGGLYLHAGQRSGIEQVVPGVEVTVLGPPTVDEWPRVASQSENDPEYWVTRGGLVRQMLSAVSGSASEVAAAVDGDDLPDPGPIRWLVQRMRDQHTHSLLRIVRTLDDALNNTSLILLFKVGARRLLFPGDAQIENWSFTLDAPVRTVDLSKVDLYKVGHHGSRNATPRSLVKLWEPRTGRITSLMSTMPGVHGETEATAVPRATLTAALEQLGPLRRTDGLGSDELSLTVEASSSGRKPFELVSA